MHVNMSRVFEPLGVTLVTGGCGWFGRSLVYRLYEQREDLGITDLIVTDIVPFNGSLPESFRATRIDGASGTATTSLDPSKNEHFHYHKCDLTNHEEVGEMIEKWMPHTVFSIAAVIDLRKEELIPDNSGYELRNKKIDGTDAGKGTVGGNVMEGSHNSSSDAVVQPQLLLRSSGNNRCEAVNVFGVGYLLGALSAMEKERSEGIREGVMVETNNYRRRFIHCSSHDVSDIPYDLCIYSKAPYKGTKARGEHLVHEYFKNQIHGKAYDLDEDDGDDYLHDDDYLHGSRNARQSRNTGGQNRRNNGAFGHLDWEYVVIRPSHIVSPAFEDDVVAMEFWSQWPTSLQVDGTTSKASFVSISTLIKVFIGAAKINADSLCAAKIRAGNLNATKIHENPMSATKMDSASDLDLRGDRNIFYVKDVDVHFYVFFRKMIQLHIRSIETKNSANFISFDSKCGQTDTQKKIQGSLAPCRIVNVPAWILYFVAWIIAKAALFKVICRRYLLRLTGDKSIAYKICPPRHPFLTLTDVGVRCTAEDFFFDDTITRRVFNYDTNPEMLKICNFEQPSSDEQKKIK